jgi:hypothetical protein
MAMKLAQGRIQEFVTALENIGGSSGNGSLREALGWDEEFYWRVQGHLIGEGRLVAGRGRGGSVRLTETDATASEAAAVPVSAVAKEKNLYAPLKAAIEGKWIKRFGFDLVLVDETHRAGPRIRVGRSLGRTSPPSVVAATSFCRSE